MAASVLVRIERVLGKTNAFINAAALTENAEDAYQTFWNRMETPFQRVEGEDSDAYFRFASAYEDFQSERTTMPAIVLGLKDVGYLCPEAIETQYMALAENPRAWAGTYQAALEQLYPSKSERAEALAKTAARIQKLEEETDWRPPGLLENLRELQQALEKARKWLKTQKRPKRKRKRASDKPRKPRPLTPRQIEVAQIVGECKGNMAVAARRLGRDRSTVAEIYGAAMAKLGKEAVRSPDKTRLFVRDKRGQEAVSREDDLRRR